MGFPFLKVVNIIGTLVETGRAVYNKFFTPDDGDHTDLTVNTGITYMFSNLLPQIDKYRALGQLSTEEQIDAFFDKADAQATMFPGMPVNIAEQFTDHTIEAGRIYAKNKAKIPGYFIAG